MAVSGIVYLQECSLFKTITARLVLYYLLVCLNDDLLITYLLVDIYAMTECRIFQQIFIVTMQGYCRCSLTSLKSLINIIA